MFFLGVKYVVKEASKYVVKEAFTVSYVFSSPFCVAVKLSYTSKPSSPM